VDQALVAVAGIVIGALLGGSGKYFTSRRDAWAEARASGLLLLAGVRAVREARLADPFDASFGVESWESNEAILAHFRRGSFPNGFKAPEWLALAACFARLERFQAQPQADRGDEWSTGVDSELLAAEELLSPFEDDPPVVGYVIRARAMGFFEMAGRVGLWLDAAVSAWMKWMESIVRRLADY
jgi:hypothetical protein